MSKFPSKIDFTLIFRLSLSIVMLFVAYQQSDKVSGAFGLFLAIYAIIGAKYKVGCGYNNCGYAPRYNSKLSHKDEANHVDFTEIK
jgi:hypothetical protein